MFVRPLFVLLLISAQTFCTVGRAQESGTQVSKKIWEVAVLFVGADEDQAYQKDVDGNILELARLHPSESFRLTVFREQSFGGRALYFDVDSSTQIDWSAILSEKPVAPLELAPGFSKEFKKNRILSRGPELSELFENAFRIPDSHRLLLIYGHGLGPKGLSESKLKDLRASLEKALPSLINHDSSPEKGPLDLLWLDACLMASVEVAYELRGLTKLFVSSQDQEFATGSPMSALSILETGELISDEELAVQLGESYLQSYSFIRGGEQSKSVITSPATLSVINVSKLGPLIEKLSDLVSLIGKLTPESRAALSLRKDFRKMGDPDFSDLGFLIQKMGELGEIPVQAQTLAKEIQILLELGQPASRNSNVQIELETPIENALMVYGYNWWGAGYEGDQTFEGKIPEALTPDRQVKGPDGRLWPAKVINQSISFSPFTPNANEFRYYFADPFTEEPISEEVIYTRTRDNMSFRAESDSNPVIWVGYTEGVGAAAERYTGLSILEPTQGATNIPYLELEFALKTRWGAL